MGAITGMMSLEIITSTMCGLTESGSPTNPRSTNLVVLDFGSWLCFSNFFAIINLASLPEMPQALPPSALMAETISLLIEPARTICTISTVARSVTRNPSLNSVLICNRSSMAPICGPPPCTTIGFTPACFNRTISLAKLFASSASPMALPPYFTTTVWLS